VIGPPPDELDEAGADEGCTDTGAAGGAADAGPPGTGAPADAEHAASPARSTARSGRVGIFMSQRR
jgi:hypothetical protein